MVGEDKHENEELIKWGYNSLVWFHVDKLSSAHIYLELREDQTVDDIPQALLDDCVQLVKANSIQGNKMNNIDVVYTLWSNLKKTNDMVVGQVRALMSIDKTLMIRLLSKECQKNTHSVIHFFNDWSTIRLLTTHQWTHQQVGFHNDKLVKKVRCERRINSIVNRLNKTKTERKQVDFREEKEKRDAIEREKLRKLEKENQMRLEREKKERQELAKQKSYDAVFANAAMKTNKDPVEDLEDDFMWSFYVISFLLLCARLGYWSSFLVLLSRCFFKANIFCTKKIKFQGSIFFQIVCLKHDRWLFWKFLCTL